MRYEDFVIEISSKEDGRYSVEARDRDLDRASAELKLPFEPQFAWERFADLRRTFVDSDHADSLERSVGIPLFERLFAGRVGRSLQRAVDALTTGPEVEGGRGLRIRLLFGRPSGETLQQDDLLKADYARFGSLPWEALCDPDTRTPLALDAGRVIVRTLDSPQAVRSLRVKPPFRILVVSASPTDLRFPQLEVEHERELILEALANKDVASVTPLIDPSPLELRRALRDGGHHILHFIGHGGFDPKRGEGHLAFRDRSAPSGQDALPVTGRALAEKLTDCRSLRVVFLNACRSATFPDDLGQNPWNSMAGALCLAGVPAVIAMQHKISDRAAISFSRTFYESLAAGSRLGIAVTDARGVLRDGSVEWATPVFFLRGEDDLLFSLDGEPDRDLDPTKPLLLGIRSFEEWNQAQTGAADRVLSLSSYFDHRRIRDQADWERTVLPLLRRFVVEASADRRPLDILFAAHQSIAFSAGYFLPAKSGVRLRVLQPTVNQSMGDPAKRWSKDDAPPPAGDLWSEEDDIPVDPDAKDVAVAIGLSTPVLTAVTAYVERAGLKVRRILVATGYPRPGQDAVKNGAHAWALAESVAGRLYNRTGTELGGVVHLFASAPNAFLTLLGQQSAMLGHLQLYEFDSLEGTYRPSVSLPLETASPPPPPPGS